MHRAGLHSGISVSYGAFSVPGWRNILQCLWEGGKIAELVLNSLHPSVALASCSLRWTIPDRAKPTTFKELMSGVNRL